MRRASFCFNSYYTEKEALHKSALSSEVAVPRILGLVIPVYRGQTGFSSVSINFYEKSMVKTEPTRKRVALLRVVSNFENVHDLSLSHLGQILSHLCPPGAENLFFINLRFRSQKRCEST